MIKKEGLSDVEELKLKKLIKLLKSIKGRGTQLISYYIPAGYNLQAAIRHIDQEIHTAQNIKSRLTRKNVMAALEKIAQELRNLHELPKNGLIVFCGNIASQEGATDLRIWLIEPPYPLNIRLYRCDQTFITEPLEKMLKEKTKYGLVVVDLDEATFGILQGKHIEVIKNIHSLVPRKMRAGGQSAQRFQRVREGLIEDWYKKIVETIQELFLERHQVDGILIGGPGVVKENLQSYLTNEIKKKVIGYTTTCYTGEMGLRELVNRSLDILQNEKLSKEKKVVNEFFYHISRDTGLAIYGKEDVIEALRNGLVDKLLLSEDIDEEEIEEFEKLAKATGATIYIISKETEEGSQFTHLTKYGAILRFKVS